MKKIYILDKKGQGTLEFFLLIAFITVVLMVAINFFFPSLKNDFVGVSNIVETYVESGSGFK